MARTRGLDRARALARTLNRDRDRARELTLDRIRPRILALARDRARFIDLDLVLVRTSNENFWDIILDSPDIAKSLLDTIIEIFGIQPAPHWYEALRTGFLPKVPERLVMMDENRWKEVEAAFETGTATEGDVFFAAWMLLYDCWLYFVEYHSSPDESIFRRVAELTSDLDAPPLRIAHCIRDLAYGDESRGGDLEKMVKSDEPAYREIFEACYWRATPDEEARGL